MGFRIARGALALGALLATPALAGGGGEGGSPVIRNIAIAMVAASLLGFTMKLLRQPLLLGYILGGVLVGPVGLRLITGREEIQTIAEIGLILLLFMIGLEIDLKKMLQAGRLVVLTGILQFPLSLGVAAAVFALLRMLGVSFGDGVYPVLYLAVAVSISSTMIVVKLLYDKLELDTLAGRITVGILVFQDIWAIVVLAVQPNLANPELGMLAKTFGAGALLVAVSLVTSRYVLPRIFQVIAKVPELMLVISLGWCFLVGLVAAHPSIGLSMEMGALIAGVSLATFPYNLDVNAKVLNIRDFFITLFFVSLGMQIPMPTVSALLLAALASAVLLLTRAVGIFGVLHVQKAGHFTSLLPALNLSQMSEFSLVILSLGVSFGHITGELLTVAIWTFAFLAVGSTYLIAASHPVERVLSRILNRVGLRDVRSTASEVKKGHDRSVVLLGFYRIANAFLEEAARRDQHLLEDLKVVDFNPEMRKRLAAVGVPCVYGDIGNPETLQHAHIEHARVVISTVPDSVLRGTSNAKLLKVLKELCPQARVIVTAETPEQALALYAGGADFVLQPNALAGASLVTTVEQALRGSCQGMRQEAESDLVTRTGKNAVLPQAGAAQ
ncbi:MAG: cation:proton antiporter [Myxococcota bacterium]|nr:cation:proton antiporter [Myxococcota bacterium]